MPDQHVDFRDFCQHDVLDNMDYAALNSTCFALIFFVSVVQHFVEQQS